MWHVSVYNFITYTYFSCNKLRDLQQNQSLPIKTLTLNQLSFTTMFPRSTTSSSFLLITSDAAIFPHYPPFPVSISTS